MASQIFMINIEGILYFGIIDFPLDMSNEYVDPFDPAILWERKTFYEIQWFKNYGGSILKPFGVHSDYSFYHVFMALANDFP